MHHYSKTRGGSVYSDREGLIQWCAINDKRFKESRRARRWSFNTTVPCFSDYIRYTQWHNYANEMTEKLDIPAYTLFYENYTQNFDETTRELYNFLEQPVVNDPLEFDSSKDYRHMFATEDMQAAKVLIKSLASEKTWGMLEHYFETTAPALSSSPVPASMDKSNEDPEIAWLSPLYNQSQSPPAVVVAEIVPFQRHS
jgi:hypothetical protein